MNEEENIFPYSRMSTKKYRNDEKIIKAPFGNQHSNI